MKRAVPIFTLHVWCTAEEHQRLKESISKTTARSISAYVRAVLFTKDVALKTRSQSADDILQVAVQIKNDLRALRKAHEMALQQLYALSSGQDLQQRLALQITLQQELTETIKNISLHLHQIYQRCLQE